MAEPEKQLSDVDAAFHILKNSGQSMYFRDLISSVLDRKRMQVHSLPQAMSEVHTQINMDSRFLHMGKGMWGLSEWSPQRGAKVADDSAATVSDARLRREKLLEEIQQDYVAAAQENEESE